jgi:hypothetical protein
VATAARARHRTPRAGVTDVVGGSYSREGSGLRSHASPRPPLRSLDRLLRARDGTVFVSLNPALRAQEVQLEDERYDFRTQAMARLLRGRPLTCAIFHWIPPDAFTVRCKPARLEAVVMMQAGVLTQVDWRRAFAGWRAASASGAYRIASSCIRGVPREHPIRRYRLLEGPCPHRSNDAPAEPPGRFLSLRWYYAESRQRRRLDGAI